MCIITCRELFSLSPICFLWEYFLSLRSLTSSSKQLILIILYVHMPSFTFGQSEHLRLELSFALKRSASHFVFLSVKMYVGRKDSICVWHVQYCDHVVVELRNPIN